MPRRTDPDLDESLLAPDEPSETVEPPIEETAAEVAGTPEEASDSAVDPVPEVQVKLNPDYKVPQYDENLDRTLEAPESAEVSVPGFDTVTLTPDPITVSAQHAEALVFSPAAVRVQE